MVRFKKRYFVLEYERASHINQSNDSFDLEPLNSRDIDIANAVKDRVEELHGDFGRASMTVGFKYDFLPLYLFSRLIVYIFII